MLLNNRIFFDETSSLSSWDLEVLISGDEFWLLLFLAVKRKKRKMGMYNLVPKKKAKALKQRDKAGAFYLYMYVTEVLFYTIFFLRMLFIACAYSHKKTLENALWKKCSIKAFVISSSARVCDT